MDDTDRYDDMAERHYHRKFVMRGLTVAALVLVIMVLSVFGIIYITQFM